MATVRRGTLADADAIGRVHVRAWQTAYAELLPADGLKSLDPDERAEQWRDRLRTPIPGQEVLVAVDAGAVVGFALIGAGDSGRASELGEVYALNLTPEAWGRGLGKLLMQRAEAELARQGNTKANLWVMRDNVRARRFYERLGWQQTDNERVQTLLAVEVPEVEYTRALESAELE